MSRNLLALSICLIGACTPARTQLSGPPAVYNRSLMVESEVAFTELHMARALDRAADAELKCDTVDFPMERACATLRARRQEVHRALWRYEHYQGALLSAAAHQVSRRALRVSQEKADSARELYIASIFDLSAPSLAILGEHEALVSGGQTSAR